MNQIIEYINEKYNPVSIILYGSYADGTNNLNSDFDALVISNSHGQYHDTSFVNNIQLDVFVYPASYFKGNYNCKDFIQIYDSKILSDENKLGESVREAVISFVHNLPKKTESEVKSNIDWCVKMLKRAKRGDAEGMFRWHWVLIDSLEIFCNVVNHHYFGPKKSLRWMKENYSDDFMCYEKALNTLSIENLEKWILCINNINLSLNK